MKYTDEQRKRAHDCLVQINDYCQSLVDSVPVDFVITDKTSWCCKNSATCKDDAGLIIGINSLNGNLIKRDDYSDYNMDMIVELIERWKDVKRNIEMHVKGDSRVNLVLDKFKV